MTEPISVYVARTNVLEIQLSYDVSQDTITSQIRQGRNSTTPLIVEWEVSFKTDGQDGALLLRLDDSALPMPFDHRIGYMDLKRISNGEPVPTWVDPLQVVFRLPVTL